MQKLIQIDNQITTLQEKKKQLEIKRAISLVKQLQKILQWEFSEELILGLITWARSELKTHPEMKEIWRKSVPQFLRPRSAKS